MFISGNCWPRWKLIVLRHSSFVPIASMIESPDFCLKRYCQQQQLGKTTSLVHLSWKKSMTPENINKSNKQWIHFGGFDVNSDNFHFFISAKALNEWPPHVCFQLIVTSQAPEWPYLSTSVHNGAILEIPGVFWLWSCNDFNHPIYGIMIFTHRIHGTGTFYLHVQEKINQM